MIAAIPFPGLEPEIFSVEFGGFVLALRWYALAYVVGFLIAWRGVVALAGRPVLWGGEGPISAEQAERLLTWIIIGVIIGGRLGFVLFYDPAHYLAHPADIPKIWQGGMAFHGGFAGLIVAVWAFCRKEDLQTASVGDAIAITCTAGLFLGRIANFINAELWGRPTLAAWGVIFPGDAAQACGPDFPLPCARHPSQLYEALLEGAILGGLLLWLALRRGTLKVPGTTIGIFLLGYGAARFAVEFFRLADAQFRTLDNPLGHVIRLGSGSDAWGLTMGQALSLPMVAIGLTVIVLARRGTWARS